MPKNISHETRFHIQNCPLPTAAAAQKFHVDPRTVRRWRQRSTTQTLPRGTEEARNRFVEDLENLFESAWAEGNWAVALRAKELLGKEQGFLGRTKIVTQFIDPSVETISDENIDKLLEAIHEKVGSYDKGSDTSLAASET